MTAQLRRIAILILGWIFILLGIVGLFLPFLQGFLFLFIGVLLFAYYGQRAPVTAPDQVFPHFIANGLPAGLSGLVVAAILAAAMSST